MIWLTIICVALLGFAWIALPLFRTDQNASARVDGELTVYRDQLAELGNDVERGLITQEQAAVDEIEISRRMLAASETGQGGQSRGLAGPARNVAVGSLALVAVLGPLTFYNKSGSPELGAQPYVAVAAASSRQETGGMGPAIERLVTRLNNSPDDFDGWVLLAKSYTFAKDLDNAAQSWGRAFELRPEDVDVAGSYAEALTLTADGIVPPAAVLIFEQLRQEVPADPRNHYYVGLAESQAGRGQAAIDIWMGLLAASPADAPWVPEIRQRIELAAQQFSIKVGDLKTLPASQAARPMPVAPGPTAEDMAAASQMSSDEQADMIRSMVARLSDRLEENPDDIDGWLRLARAQSVLDGPASAKPSLQRALGVATTDAERQAIQSAAAGLGVALDGS